MGSEGTKFGKYILIRRIASGGMAEIYLARQEGMAGFAREVVIKRIHAHLGSDPEFVNMFLDEARLVAKLSHPNIVSVHEFGQEEGAHYLAMEFVDGYPVSAAIKRSKGIEPAHALRVASEMCAGLYYAHSLTDESGQRLGIVHRDISPQNVLLSFDGSVKLIDFGIAKAETQSHKTRAGSLKGKYSYMSPEQARGKVIDQRTDIHAVGIVLWEMLAGRSLYFRESMFDTMEAVMSHRPRSVRFKHTDLDPGIDAVIDKALAKDPDERYQTAAEMQMAIDEFTASKGLHSSSLRLGRYVRKLFQDSKPPSEGPSAPTPSGSISAPTPSGAMSAPTPSSIRSVVTPSGAHSVLTPSGNVSLPPPVPPQATPTGQRRAPPPPPPSAQAKTPSVKARPATPPAVTPSSGTKLPPGPPSMTPSSGTKLPPGPPPSDAEDLEETIELTASQKQAMAQPAPEVETAAPAPAPDTSSQPLPVQGSPDKFGGLWWLFAGLVVVALLAVGLVFALGSPPSSDDEVAEVPQERPAVTSPPIVVPERDAGTEREPSMEVGADVEVSADAAVEGPPDLGLLPPMMESSYLTVISTPRGAVMWLDGRRTGERTVVRDFPIDAGEHVVELALSGHHRWRKTVTIEPGGSETLRAQLQEDPNAPREPDDGAGDDDDDDGDPVDYGLLTLDTTPASRVYLGRRRLGRTPLESVEVPTGQYQITMVISGGRRFRRSISIRTGRTTRHNFDLLAAPEDNGATE